MEAAAAKERGNRDYTFAPGAFLLLLLLSFLHLKWAFLNFLPLFPEPHSNFPSFTESSYRVANQQHIRTRCRRAKQLMSAAINLLTGR